MSKKNTTKRTLKKMDKIYFDSFCISGFSYYDGALIFKDILVGEKVDIIIDDNNSYDQHALALGYQGHKLGFIPKRKNQVLSKLIRSGHDIFEAYIQQKDPTVHPEEQVRVIVYVKSTTGKEFTEIDDDTPYRIINEECLDNKENR
jgi:hypothetical protein